MSTAAARLGVIALSAGVLLVTASPAMASGRSEALPSTGTPLAITITQPLEGQLLISPSETTSPQFTADRAIKEWTCQVDSGPVAPCFPGKPLAAGNPTNDPTWHELTVRGRDLQGQEGVARRRWRVYRPQDTAITAGPADGSTINTTAVSFAFVATKAPAGATMSFTCSLFPLANLACPTGFTSPPLSEGEHTFEVTSVADFGNGLRAIDATPATRTWTVGTTPPDTQIVIGPEEGLLTTSRSARFVIASEPGARFQCALDGGPMDACPAVVTHESLALGKHEFRARAIDVAGNVDATPTTRTWTIVADRDGDGYLRENDCDDGNAAIHPGARDIPQDGVDQDCSGHDAPFPRLTASPRAQWRFSPFRFTKLFVDRVAARSRIEVRCRGGGCPLRRSVTPVRRSTAVVSVIGALKRASLERGATVEVIVTKPGYDGVMRRYKVRGPRQAPQASSPR